MAVICALQMLPNKCDVNLVEEIKPAPCEAESLSPSFPHPLSLFSTQPLLLRLNLFFFKFPKLLVHMLPNECSHQMSHKHADFLAGFVAAASVATF